MTDGTRTRAGAARRRARIAHHGIAIANTLACILLLGACHSTWRLALTPRGIPVIQGGRFDAKVSLGDAPRRVALSLAVDGAPKGITASFDPPRIGGELPETSRLRVTAAPGMKEGVYSLRVLANGEPHAEVMVGVRAAPLASVRLDSSLRPQLATLAEVDPARPPRPTARIVDETGAGADLVADEILVVSDDRAAVAAIAQRWQGQVIESFDPSRYGIRGVATIHRIHVRSELDDGARLAGDLATLGFDRRGALRVSSAAGLGTLGIAAAELRRGGMVGINWIAAGASLIDRRATEAPAGPTAYTPDPFQWSFLRAGGPLDIGVTEAWRALAIAEKLSTPVSIAVVDGGFSRVADLPDFEALTSAIGTADPSALGENPMKCSGTPCPWHGTYVAEVIAAKIDDGRGTAGVAAPVAKLTTARVNGDMFTLLVVLPMLANKGARILNMSFAVPVPMLLYPTLLPLEAVTAALGGSTLLFAAAGNDGRDVDETALQWIPPLPFPLEVETTWVYPCENSGVHCIGGIDASRHRNASSAYGHNDVQMFAPYTVYEGTAPDQTQNVVHEGSGTSYSSPFVAGVAALEWAANPGLGAEDVWNTLVATANTTPDGTAPRYVNAARAVKAALGPVPPYLKIVRPADGTTGVGGQLNLTALNAEVHDIRDDDDAIEVSWSSNVDGPLGKGRWVSVAFTRPGQRTITATARNRAGLTTSRSVTYTATWPSPEVIIAAPAQGQVVVRGQAIGLAGSATDGNGPIACTRLRWSSTAFGGAPTGCALSLTLDGPPGPTPITLSAVDAMDRAASKTVTVQLVDPPPSGPPIASIVSPSTDIFLPKRDALRLEGDAVSPGGKAIVSYRWTMSEDGGPATELATGRLTTVDASTWHRCQRRTVVITLHVKDASGQEGSASRTVAFDWGPC